MANVPEPVYGEVDWYVRLFRRTVKNRDYLDTAALGIVQVTVGDVSLSDEWKVERIKNILTAADLINAETVRPLLLRTAADLGEDFDRSQTADADDTLPPVTGRRREPHTGSLTDEGLVDEDDDSFRFGQHDDKPLHFLGDRATVCGVEPHALPVGEGWTLGRESVTCPGCRERLDLPPVGEVR